MGIPLKKPIITDDQLIKASHASKNFGALRKRAKELPQFILDNGSLDSVLLSYKVYAEMYQRLAELEEKEEADVLTQRIDRLKKEPALAVPWKDVRRHNKHE